MTAALRIVGLSRLDPADSDFGGKACGLARLIAAGARVPAGFAVAATTVPPARWPEADRAAFHARAARLLAYGPLAVRSSAIAEDSAERSFAGLFETVLGTATPEEALAGAAACIASGGTGRVLECAGTASPLPVGLVVQTLLEPATAGVCFTRDPAGRDGAVVVEVVRGGGGKLVSGAVEPERWRLYPSGLGGWEGRAEAATGVLGAAEAERVAERASELAERFGTPLDLEWAVDGNGTLWWLQGRPITAAPVPPRFVVERFCEEADDGPVTVWSNWNVRETLPDPMFPLTWTYWRDVVAPMATELASGVPHASTLGRHLLGLDLVHGRIYFNMNALLASPLLGSQAQRLRGSMDARAGEIVRRLRAAGVLRPRRLPGSRLRLLAGTVAAGLRGAARMGRALRPRRALRALEQEGLAIAGRPDVARLTDRELIAEMRLWLGPECRRLRGGLQLEMAAILVYSAARRAFAAHPEAARLLASGIPADPTTEISLAIDELVASARPLAALPGAASAFREALSAVELESRLAAEPGGAEWLGRFREFLRRFGHRGPMEFDLGASRWSEDPTMILELVRSGLASPARECVAERLARLARARRRAVAAAAAASPAWRRPLMRRLARLVEVYMALREAPKHHAVRVFQRARLAALELGGRLAGSGVLGRREDVFFLEWPELVALAGGEPPAAGLGRLLAERRDRLERFRAERAPDFLRSDGVPVVEETAPEGAEEGVLRGTAISPGRAAGAVRVLREPDPRAFADGEVLVVEYADPGWTPLFPRAAAVVMEVGGLMCHAAVVARELGVPAVFGVRGATRILSDGERVAVDGSAGRVTRG